jgi:hypothetical protein
VIAFGLAVPRGKADALLGKARRLTYVDKPSRLVFPALNAGRESGALYLLLPNLRLRLFKFTGPQPDREIRIGFHQIVGGRGSAEWREDKEELRAGGKGVASIHSTETVFCPTTKRLEAFGTMRATSHVRNPK